MERYRVGNEWNYHVALDGKWVTFIDAIAYADQRVREEREAIISELREHWGKEGSCSKLAIEIVQARGTKEPEPLEKLNTAKEALTKASHALVVAFDAVEALRRA